MAGASNREGRSPRTLHHSQMQQMCTLQAHKAEDEKYADMKSELRKKINDLRAKVRSTSRRHTMTVVYTCCDKLNGIHM